MTTTIVVKSPEHSLYIIRKISCSKNIASEYGNITTVTCFDIADIIYLQILQILYMILQFYKYLCSKYYESEHSRGHPHLALFALLVNSVINNGYCISNAIVVGSLGRFCIWKGYIWKEEFFCGSGGIDI